MSPIPVKFHKPKRYKLGLLRLVRYHANHDPLINRCSLFTLWFADLCCASDNFHSNSVKTYNLLFKNKGKLKCLCSSLLILPVMQNSGTKIAELSCYLLLDLTF